MLNTEKITPTTFNTNRKLMVSTEYSDPDKLRGNFLSFLHDAWRLAPDYVSKDGPTFCNLSAVRKECSPSDILNQFSISVAFFLNGNRSSDPPSILVDNGFVHLFTYQG
jgi:hypothetical protein